MNFSRRIFIKARSIAFTLLALISLVCSHHATASGTSIDLINGQPINGQFPGVLNASDCTTTKIGPKHFLTAAHCVRMPSGSYTVYGPKKTLWLKIIAKHIHPSWIKDCHRQYDCDGKEVGGPRMTPGRADVALIIVKEDTPEIPIIQPRFTPIQEGTEVAMVGKGCTRGITPGGEGPKSDHDLRYAITRTVGSKALEHKHSLYAKISSVTAQADWITPGYKFDQMSASLCPGDSGGPLLAKNTQGAWEIIGVAADYTFDGPYSDGELTMTNLHTRIDDQSYFKVGLWLRPLL